MASGAYLLSDHLGEVAVERFTCGAGPLGWRYVATRSEPGSDRPLGALDLVVDAAGRTVRLSMTAGGWELRGGAVGPELLWRRGDVEHAEVASGFTGTSPAFLVAGALAPGRHRRVRVDDGALATRVVEVQWDPAGTAEREGLALSSYDVTDLQTGERVRVVLHGDVVVDAPGVQLLHLDSLV